MSRRSLYVLVLSGVFGLLAPHARAQTTQAFTQGITLKVDGKNRPNSGKVYVNRKECKTPSSYEFTAALTGTGAVQGYQVPVLEVWGTNQGIDCSDKANRLSGTNTKSKCYFIWRSGSSPAIRVGQANKVTVTADLLFQSNGSRDKKCDLNAPAPSSIDIYFVPLSAQTPDNTGDAPVPVTMAAVGKATFTLFTVLPASPTGVGGDTGENQLTAHWSAADIGGTRTTYKVYFDWGAAGTGTPMPPEADAGTSTEKDAGTKDAGTGGVITTDSGMGSTTGDSGTHMLIGEVTSAETASCGSGALLEGREPPNTGTKLVGIESDGTSQSLTDLDAKGIPINTSVAASVVTIDVAGNESLLSTVVCIQRVKTNGFWSQCKDDPKCKDQFDTCSAQPWRPVQTPLTALCLTGGALLYWRRRRRNV